MKQKFTLLLLVGMLLVPAILNAQSPYIYKVYDFQPAPGQFVNVLPQYKTGDTKEDMITYVENYISGTESFDVSLGAYGGYIIFGFDHPILNVKGENDFRILGNAHSGSSEPGIVMVSFDANQNGIPDDEWYELAGSEYYKGETIKNYQITYYKPSGNSPTPDPNDSTISDMYYIRWTDNQGGEGYVPKNVFHTQCYWAEWLENETLTFAGTKLADNYYLDGDIYKFNTYDWGYVDNLPNAEDAGLFNIEWAIDGNGNPASLDEIHFIKVYTAVNQYCGRVGESSTEISGAIDLHPTATHINDIEIASSFSLLQNPVTDRWILTSEKQQQLTVYNMQGKQVDTFTIHEGTNRIPCSLASGFYILKAENAKPIKFIKK